MVTKVINLDQQSDSLSDLLTQLDANTEILLVRGDIPIARITSTDDVQLQAQLTKRIPDLHAGMIRASDDFDEPLIDM